MAKSANQKLKLLYLNDYLRENSNVDHPVSREQIESYLKSMDISVERKTIYSDIECLNEYGVCIEKVPGKFGGYYCDSGRFELGEIKMLVDSVQSSKFITEKQSSDLIRKLEKLTNKYEAGQLHRQVVVQDRVKTEQTNIFTNIDHITDAISSDRKIRFKYMQYNVYKELEARHDGREYEVSPLTLLWDSENYYLVAYDSEYSDIKHYRVDKMKNIHASDAKREGTDRLSDSEISSYNKKVFGMYHGDKKKVTIRFNSYLIGVILDRFGKDTIVIPSENKETFTITVEVAVSKQFYSWLCGFPGECEVLEPADVREELKKIGETLANQYR